MPDKEETASNEFFYRDKDGNKQDEKLHGPILRAVDFPIDEKIMKPIRERRRAAHLAEQEAAAKTARLKSQWQRTRARSQELLKHYPGGQDHDQQSHAGNRGGDDDKPKDTKDAVKGYKPGIKAYGDIDAVRQRWVDESPIKDMDDVIRAAPIAQANFGSAATKIATDLGVTFKNAAPKTHKMNKETGELEINEKGIARINEKLADRVRAGKSAEMARITDTARGTFVLNTPEDAQKVIDALAKTHEVVDEGWRTIKESYYTDRPMLFRDRETGLIGEVQLAHADLLDAKDNKGGHKLYEDSRSLPKGDVRIPGYRLRMQKLYGDILDKLPTEWRVIDGRPDYFGVRRATR